MAAGAAPPGRAGPPGQPDRQIAPQPFFRFPARTPVPSNSTTSGERCAVSAYDLTCCRTELRPRARAPPRHRPARGAPARRSRRSRHQLVIDPGRPGERHLRAQLGQVHCQPVGAPLTRQPQHQQQRPEVPPIPTTPHMPQHDLDLARWPRCAAPAAGPPALAGEVLGLPGTSGRPRVPVDDAPAPTAARRHRRSAAPALHRAPRPTPAEAGPSTSAPPTTRTGSTTPHPRPASRWSERA